MARRNWSDDSELLSDVADAVRPEPDEHRVRAASREVFAWQGTGLDRALAALLYDSLDGLAAVRGPVAGAPRNLVFELGEQRVEIELSDAGIEGQLVPPEPGTVWLLDVTGPVAETTADEVGCFSFPARRRGPIRIECAVSGRRLATGWITG